MPMLRQLWLVGFIFYSLFFIFVIGATTTIICYFILYSLFLLLVPHDKQHNNLSCSVITGKSQTSTYPIDQAIARSMRQGLSFRV